MRTLRQQFIKLVDDTQHQKTLDILPRRLKAALIHDALPLLPLPGSKESKKRVSLHARTISHGELYRHLIIIRCPDQAFYLDAIKGYLLRHDIQAIGQQTMLAMLICDDHNCTLDLRHPDQCAETNFMFIALHLSATLTPDCQAVARDISVILRAVDLSVCDFTPMHNALSSISKHLQQQTTASADLLNWLNDDRYLLFAYRSDKQRLGLMHDYRTMDQVAPHLRKEIDALNHLTEPGIEWLHLAACHNYLYSAANIEVLRLCWKDEHGALAHAILIGHFSRSARHNNASQTPWFKTHWLKLNQSKLLQQSSFYRREVRTLYDRLPKSLLYSIPATTWLPILKGIIDLTTPIQTIHARLQPTNGNLDYLFIAMSAKRFGANVLNNIEQSLAGVGLNIQGRDSFGVNPHRIIIIAVQQQKTWPKSTAIKLAIQQCIVFWKDQAKADVLRHAKSLDLPVVLAELEQIPMLYRELFPPHQFLKDIYAHQKVQQSGRTLVQVKLLEDGIELHIFAKKALLLGKLVDRIQAFGLIAMQEAVVDFGQKDSTTHISSLHCQSPDNLHPEGLERLAKGLEHVLNDEADHDPINALLITAGLDIDQISVLITLRNHLIQLIPDAAPLPLSDMLKRYPQASNKLFRMFEAQHRPAMPKSYIVQAKLEFEQILADVQSLTDDRWLRALAELIEAGLRTNAFQREVNEPVAIKIATKKLSFAPPPALHREVFVHGIHVEGVHLRAGPVARGGIRFSDRPTDFRTEVLDLVTTQVVKNGQIVPTGAKGGFVIRGGCSPEFVLQQYRSFIRSLLKLSDNLVGGKAVAPEGFRIPEEDKDDTYLVVAADKGTARYSDDANDEAQQAGFWLDDAFASGGKVGYDHKVVGITARGAWVCAAHHFAQIGQDAYLDPIQVVAIGDMGGDVFGNGMILNPNMLLLGAFNHRHIFLDPNPNAHKAFNERKRLFAAVGGWDQYDHDSISEGGGIFDRSAKHIDLSNEIRKALGIQEQALSGEALIRALLSAPVDMLYNGGIGTYIKAGNESHNQVQDPANNAVRIDAGDLRCKSICEGGNLGMTQRARLEYAENEGILNTDAIDNSAGVDMSDHEVNLKILFSATDASTLGTSQRNRLLKRLTDIVTEQCLNNNLYQSRVLTLANVDAAEHLPRLLKLRDTLLKDRRIDLRTDPGMSQDETLILRPQLAVMLGHEKNRIHDALDDDGFSQHSLFSTHLLHDYFPSTIAKKFPNELAAHPLAGGIVHTHASNNVINHMGLTSIHHLQSLTDASISSIVEVLLLVNELTDAQSLRQSLWQQEGHASLCNRLQHGIQEHLMHFAEEMLRLNRSDSLTQAWVSKQQKELRRFRSATQGLGYDSHDAYPKLLDEAEKMGLEHAQAVHLAAMPELAQSSSAIYLSNSKNLPLSRCLKAVQACLHLLPFVALETPLRSQQWGDKEAHELRREWLHRLTLLKSRAAGQLLEKKSDSLLAFGKEKWSQHKHWQALQALMHPNESSRLHEEDQRMKLMLALTHLESVIDES